MEEGGGDDADDDDVDDDTWPLGGTYPAAALAAMCADACEW